MIFKKEDFNFLKSYGILADTQSFLNDKVHFDFSMEKNEVVVSQLSNSFNIITTINVPVDQSFSFIIDGGQFYSLISLLPEGENVEITETEIKFGKSKYELPKYQGDYSSVSLFLEKVKDQNSKEKILDLQRMLLVKNYVGIDDLHTIALIEGKFLASNRTDITGSINTLNKESIEKYFPVEFVSMVATHNLSEIEICSFENNDCIYDYFQIDNSYFIINEKEYSLENIFKDEIKDLYNHSTNVKINKADLIQALTRIAIVARDNIYNRIFISFDDANMIIESIDVGYSVEKVPFILISDEIKSVKIIVSANNMKTILQSLTQENITIKISSDPDALAISFEDEEKDRLFIHTLYENIDE